MKSNHIEVSTKITEYLSSLLGDQEAEKYFDYIKQEPAQYIRANSLKTDVKELQAKLLKYYDISISPVDNLPYGFVVNDSRRLLGKTLEHILGQFYIQSLSSMIPPIVLNPHPGDTVLDLCSAPGSKSTQLAELMNNKGLLMVNEVQLDRLKSLVFNLDRMNVINAGVIHSKGELLSKSFNNRFDKILVDAPCSGLGIMQKKGEVSSWWSSQKVNNLTEIQYKLLVSALKMLKPGGEIVYSTCTMTVEENEMIIDKLLKKFPFEVLPITLPIPSNNAKTAFGNETFGESLSNAKRIIPWQINSEGFFVIKMRKTDEIEASAQSYSKRGSIPFIKHKELSPYFNELENTFGIDKSLFEDFVYLRKGNDIFFASSDWGFESNDIYQRIGTRFGTIDKRNSFILHTQAAQSFDKHIKSNFYDISTREELKKYLEGGTIKTSPPFSGQGIVTFRGVMLGTASFTSEGIKSRFPRSKRTQEIFIDFF